MASKVVDTPRGVSCETPTQHSTQHSKVNSKQCGQCEEAFSKKQKAMNCSVCKFWFCLDCSHVSNKLYETLKNETSSNLPFNCDGCVRLLPSLTDIAARCKSFEDKIHEMENTMDERIKRKVEQAIDDFKEREERKCNIILHNILEPAGDEKKEEDVRQVKEIFQVMKCQDVDIKSVVRLGKPLPGKKRLVKVTLDSVNSKHHVLGGAKLLRSKGERGEPLHLFCNIFVTPDLTKDERERNAALRAELEIRKKDEKNINLVIYRNKIIDKRDISGKPRDKEVGGKDSSQGGGKGRPPTRAT